MSIADSLRSGLHASRPVFEGIDTAHTLNLCKAEEDTVRLGSRRILTALMQTLEVSFAFKHIQHIYEAYGKTDPLPVNFRAVQFTGFILPGVVAYSKSHIDSIDHPLAKRTIVFLHDNIGTISHVATLVTSVALIAIGHVALGATTIVVLGVGYLCRSRVLPYEFRSYWDKGSFLISCVTKLAIGGPFDKTIAVIEIALNALSYINDKRQEKKLKDICEQVESQKLSLPFDKIETLTLDDVEISDFHLLYAEYYLPPAPKDVTLTMLHDDIFKNFSWNKYSGLVKKKCEEDDQWHDHQHRTASTQKQDVKEEASLSEQIESNFRRVFDFILPVEVPQFDDPYLGHIEQGLLQLVDGVSHKRLQGQEPKEYETLQTKLKHIIVLLKKKDETTRANILIQLGLSAYGCSGAPHRAIDETYAQLSGVDHDQTMTGQVYHHLQWNRDRIFEEVIHKCFDPKERFKVNPKEGSAAEKVANFWKGVVDPSDIHNYHLYANLIAPEFGLTHAAGARNDQIALSDATDEWLFARIYDKERKILENHYSKEVILNIVKENMINQHIPLTDQAAGIQVWLKKVFQEQQTALQTSEIEDGDDFALEMLDKITEETGSGTFFKDPYLIAYLISIGVFKLKKNQAQKA